MKALLAGLILMIAAPLAAHPLKLSETSVSANVRTGQLEVAHSLSLHDMGALLRGIDAQGTDVIGSPAARSAVERYVAARFHIRADGRPVPLAVLGSEVENGSLWVYQEAAIPAAAELTVYSSLLLDIFDDQQNRVNVDMGRGVRTLVFRNGDAPQSTPVQ